MTFRKRSGPALTVVAGVVVLHALLVLWAWHRYREVSGARTVRRAMTVTPLQPDHRPLRDVTPAAREPTFVAPPDRPIAAPEWPAPDRPSAAATITERPAAPQSAASAPAPIQASEPRPLDLRLPPGTSHAIESANPALGQDRLTSNRKGLADAVGAALKPGDTVTIDRAGPGRTRVRSGDSCYEMVESRARQIDPSAIKPELHAVNCGN